MGTCSRKQKVCSIFISLSVVIAVCCCGCSVNPPAVQNTSLDQITQEAVEQAGIDRKNVAAVVEGTVITHDQVQQYIDRYKTQHDISSKAEYDLYLKNQGYTEWDIWTEALKELVDTVLIEVDAGRHSVYITEEELDAKVEMLESRYPNKSAWREALKSAGYTEDLYRATVRKSLLITALSKEVLQDPVLTEEQINQYIQEMAPTLVGKRSSQILFNADDYATAYETLLKIQNGADFQANALKYSIDASGLNGGDMGWDCINTYPLAYQTALDRLNVGEVSPVIRSAFGYHIILCTDAYDAPLTPEGTIDINAIPQDLKDYLISMMTTTFRQQEFENYIGNLEATATLAIFNTEGNQIAPADAGFKTEETNSN